MEDRYEKIALVTGANRGIGFEIARQLAAKQITVLMGARDEVKGVDARNRLATEAAEKMPHFILLDVTNPTSIQAAVSKIKDEFGRLDILVNNAGILIDGQTGILELDPTILQNTLDTNVFGPLLLSQACIPTMKANNYGRIVNISSTLGAFSEMAGPNSLYDQVLSPAYRLSKTILNGITILLAGQLRGTNILVNSACPGWVHTDLGGPEAPLSPEQAADTPVWLATLPDDGLTGGFFRERQPIPW